MPAKATVSTDTTPQTSDLVRAGSLDVKRVQSSYIQVADQLRDLILRGDLVTGQRLPAEAELAPSFGVSRSTIREALRILVTEGLLVTKRGVHGGTFVAELDQSRVEGVLSSAFTVLALTNKVGPREFLEAWQAIEVPAAALAARTHGGSHLQELDRTSQALPASASRSARLTQSGDFHSALLASSDNFLLVAMGRPVSTVARARFSATEPTEKFWRVNTEEHRRIYEAIAKGDEEAARLAVAEHVHTLSTYYMGDSPPPRVRAKRRS